MSSQECRLNTRRLSELCEFNPRDEVPTDWDLAVSFVPMPAVSELDGTIRAHLAKPFSEVAKGYTRFRTGDVIFAKITPCMENGKIAIATDLTNDRACGSTEFYVLRPGPEILPEYLWRFLRQASFREEAQLHMTGAVGQRRVPVQYLKNREIPTPPIAKQRRIVAKLDSVLGKSKTARGELDRIPRLVERYKQAVLAAAFGGQLSNQSDHRPADGNIPDTWTWSKLGALCEEIVDCPHTTPKWTSEGEICLRTSNFRPGQLDFSKVRYVTAGTYQERIARLEPRADDIIYSREGGILGIACQIPANVRVCLGQRMMLMRVKGRLYNPSLLMHFLNSPTTKAKVRELTGGTASPHLNVGDVKDFEVPVPPRNEQDRIVSAITNKMSAIEAVNQESGRAIALLDRLESRICADAFAGTLLPISAVSDRDPLFNEAFAKH